MLTLAQLSIVKADILANADLNATPPNLDGAYEIARLYNLPATPAFVVWRTEARVDEVIDAIDWSKFTPNDAADATAIYTNRLLVIQTKQINLQNMLQGRNTINASKPNLRAGLRDSVIALPAGALGASVSAGGAGGTTVLNACVRFATRIEKLLAAAQIASDTTGPVTARVMTFENILSPQDAEAARNS